MRRNDGTHDSVQNRNKKDLLTSGRERLSENTQSKFRHSENLLFGIWVGTGSLDAEHSDEIGTA